MKFGYTIARLRDYARRHGTALLYWDCVEYGARVRAHGSFTLRDHLIGVYTADVPADDVADDIEAYRSELRR